MTLKEVREMFLALLNRSDCAVADQDRFLTLALGRIQRELRAPLMERDMFLEPTLETKFVSLPSDYLEGIEVLVDGDPLDRTSYRDLLRGRGCDAYARYGNQLYFGTPIAPGSRLDVLYYGEFTAFVSEDDANEISSASPEILVYAALSYAGDHFEHDKRGEWEARYTSLLGQVQEQATRDEFAGGSMAIQSAYPGA